MNAVHEVLDWVFPWIDFSNKADQDLYLRAVPFWFAAIYLSLLLYTILIRSIRGPKDSQVWSQVIVKGAIIAYFSLLSLNFTRWWSAPPSLFDVVRIVLGTGAVIGIPVMLWYAWVATRDEARYRREQWRRWRAHRRRDGPDT